MKNLYPLLICVCILSVSHFNAFAQDDVDFPDVNLAAAVRDRLGLDSDEAITEMSLEALTYLSARGREEDKKIIYLTGLEKATNLRDLLLRNNKISDITPLLNLDALEQLNLYDNQISNITPLATLTSLTNLNLSYNPISDFDPISGLTNLQQISLIDTTFSDSDIPILSGLTKLTTLPLSRNEISDLTLLANVLSGMDDLGSLQLNRNQISNITPLGTLTNLTDLGTLNLSDNQISNITPLGHFTSLVNLYLSRNQISEIAPLKTLTNLQWNLWIDGNQISDLSPLENLTELRTLSICYNRYTDISPIAALVNLTRLYIDEEFVEANRALVEETTDAALVLCLPRPDPPSEPEPEPEAEPAVKRRSSFAQCGLGWSPHSQYQHHGELPKVMIYALEFEYDPERHGRYICKTIEIRTGDDAIENLAGWNLYLGTLYNPSRIPLKIPEEHSQITGRILRVTPEMLGLETFPCNTVNGISHPLPGVQYVLKTDENILVDTAYSCFVWGQNAYTTVNDKNVESPRRISSQALREMDTPRIERYITNPTGIFITDIPFEDFEWDRAVLSDWLLGLSEEMVAGSPNAPFLPDKKLTTTWGAIKKPPALRQSNFKHKQAR